MNSYPSSYMPFKKYLPPSRPPFDYGRLIKGTLSLVWRHRFLWFYGLFAGGSVTAFGTWTGNFGGSGSPDVNNDGTNPAQTATDVSNWISDHIVFIAVVGISLVVLSIAAWLWSVICRGAVIGATRDIREEIPSGFGAAWRRGRGSFGRLLLFDLLLLTIGIGVALIISATAILLIFLVLSGSTGQTLVITLGVLAAMAIFAVLITGLGYLTFVSIWFAVWVPLSIVIMYATRAIVLDGARPIAALRQGWHLLIDNLARSLLLFLLSAGLSIAGNIGAIAAVLLTAVPAGIAWIFTGAGGWHPAGIILAATLTLLPLAALILAAALINTYFTSYWTIVYLKLSGHDNDPELAHDIQPPYPPAPFPLPSN